MEPLLPTPVRVTGVIVYDNADGGYAFLDASYFGRVLILDHYKKGITEVGSWFTLLIQDNKDPTLTVELTNCQFSDASELQRAEELLPFGKVVSKTGIEQVRIQSSVFLGSILPKGGAGLSPLFGRVFFSKVVIRRLELTGLQWLKVGMVSVNPLAENFFSCWEARSADCEVAAEEKRGISIRRAQYHKLLSNNFCLLELVPPSSGYVCVLATDFAEPVEEDSLMKNEIEVITRPPLPSALSVPVPICYALLVGSEAHGTFVKRDLDLDVFEKLKNLSLEPRKTSGSETRLNKKLLEDSCCESQASKCLSNDEVILNDEPIVETLLNFAAVPEGICSPKCETIGVILEAMKDKKFVEVCNRTSPGLLADLRAFVKQVQEY